MKYQKGDKVIVLDLDYFSNPYHYKNECIKQYTVLDADEKYFSPYYKEYDRFLSGSNLFSICKQENGEPLHGDKKYYHKEKDKDVILKIINEAIEKYDTECSKNDANRIKELNNKINSCKEEIKKIKEGNGNWKVAFSTYNNKEYKEKVLTEIRKVFDF